jgi:hypothetical protein
LESSVGNAVEKNNLELQGKATHTSNIFLQKLLGETDALKKKLIELEQKQQLSAVESAGQKQRAFWSRIFD